MAGYVRTYKGRELDLPLSDENREFLTARSKDTLIASLDREWANIENNRKLTQGVEDEDDGEYEEIPYDKWKNDELIAEIRERNEGRDEAEKIPEDGKVKADFITALEADDEDNPTQE